jgi:SAM-dependent methyltransferase
VAAPAFDPEAVRAFEHARWQRAAAGYETTFAHATRPFIGPLLDAAQATGGTRLLDIACGPALVASVAHGRGAVVRGLDFSQAMLALAWAREPNIGFDDGDAEALPYPDASFDAVVANFGIHHVPRPALALREACRVLRPGGRVAFSFWAEPEENVAWKLVLDAVARHGDRAAAPAPAPGGGFGSAGQCAAALEAAGFAECTVRLVRATWQHRDALGLVAALSTGTARMAAVLEAQTPAAMVAIVRDIGCYAEAYRDAAGGIGVPIAAFIASGAKL